ncbi:hypothetical protein V5O48_012659 [Marasmius crinis-equi]|uniref:Uncharacterized protein n=1 Tax=Marasmius crinis-equi TaxID=585013 RepID=A0ABR3F2G8_9AGAR
MTDNRHMRTFQMRAISGQSLSPEDPSSDTVSHPGEDLGRPERGTFATTYATTTASQLGQVVFPTPERYLRHYLAHPEEEFGYPQCKPSVTCTRSAGHPQAAAIQVLPGAIPRSYVASDWPHPGTDSGNPMVRTSTGYPPEDDSHHYPRIVTSPDVPLGLSSQLPTAPASITTGQQSLQFLPRDPHTHHIPSSLSSEFGDSPRMYRHMVPTSSTVNSDSSNGGGISISMPVDYGGTGGPNAVVSLEAWGDVSPYNPTDHDIPFLPPTLPCTTRGDPSTNDPQSPSSPDSAATTRRQVGSQAGTKACIARRKVPATCFCDVPGCPSSGFTTIQNLHCEYV